MPAKKRGYSKKKGPPPKKGDEKEAMTPGYRYGSGRRGTMREQSDDKRKK